MAVEPKPCLLSSDRVQTEHKKKIVDNAKVQYVMKFMKGPLENSFSHMQSHMWVRL